MSTDLTERAREIAAAAERLTRSQRVDSDGCSLETFAEFRARHRRRRELLAVAAVLASGEVGR